MGFGWLVVVHRWLTGLVVFVFKLGVLFCFVSWFWLGFCGLVVWFYFCLVLWFLFCFTFAVFVVTLGGFGLVCCGFCVCVGLCLLLLLFVLVWVLCFSSFGSVLFASLLFGGFGFVWVGGGFFIWVGGGFGGFLGNLGVAKT